MQKRDDDIFRTYEYLGWISKGIKLYKVVNNLPERTNVDYDDFTEFLRDILVVEGG